MKSKIRLLLLFVLMTCLIFCFGISVSAMEVVETGQFGDNVTWELYDNDELVISGTGAMYDYDNSSSFSPFAWSGIAKVVIKDGVTSIGDGTFKYCYNLIDVNIANSVTRIGDSAFENCYNLKEITIPDSVNSIGSKVFFGCSMLKKITVDENNKYYLSDSYGVLFNKDKTRLIACPADGTFNTYSIPDSVTSIENGAFYSCAKLTAVTIPDGVTVISDEVFQGCINLISIIIPDNVTSIGNWAFNNCYNLISVTIPYGVTSIGENAFWSCSSLKKMTIPDSVTKIGGRAFSGCSSLTSITIPDSVITIENQAFYYCDSATSITIGENVSVIGFGAFCGCKSIESIYIPANVTSIDKDVFTECVNLKTIEVDINNEYYTSEDGVLFNKNKTELLRYPVFKEETKYTVPESVRIFDYYAFEGCINIEEVVVKGDITSMGSCLFQNCANLKRVQFLGQLSSICNSAFENCISLSEIIVPDSVSRIEFWAFRNCQSLKSIDIPVNMDFIGYDAFAKCNVKNIYYAGSEEDWNNITIESGNENLNKAIIHFNANCKHTDDGYATTIIEKNRMEPTYSKNGSYYKIVVCENCERELSRDRISIPALWLSNISYMFDEGVLLISGSGRIPTLDEESDYPWSQYNSTTTQIIFEGVTSVGMRSFADFSRVGILIINGESINIENEAFTNCTDLSVVVSYAALNVKTNAITGNSREIKYFVEASASNYSNINHIPFSFDEDVIVNSDIEIETYKTVIDGEVSFTENEFKGFVAALYYGSDNNFVNMIFNKLIAEDFYIYEYTSLAPLKGREVQVVENEKIYAIIEVEPGSGEYLSFTMEDFCDILASGEFDDIDYKFAVLAKAETPETPLEDENFDDGTETDGEIEEEEPAVIMNMFGSIFEAINKVISFIKKLFFK